MLRPGQNQTYERGHAVRLDMEAAHVYIHVSLCCAGRAIPQPCSLAQHTLHRKSQARLHAGQSTSCTLSESSSESSSEFDSSPDPDSSSLSVSVALSAALPACALSVSGFLAAGASTPPSSGRFASPSAAYVQQQPTSLTLVSGAFCLADTAVARADMCCKALSR